MNLGLLTAEEKVSQPVQSVYTGVETKPGTSL